MYQKILVPLDGSKRAEAILPQVVELARCMQSEIFLLSVYKVDFGQVTYFNHDPAFYEAIEADCHEKALDYLKTVQARLLDQEMISHILAQSGPVVDNILDVAQREDVDLIAMSSHGRTGLSQVIYGSVASGLLHRIDRPLLLIRAQDG